jgi:hemoglobin-like flavoprotein
MTESAGQLFVSYSHPDKSDMLIFRKHLTGMLLNEVEVWSDQDISKGAVWDSLLKGSLNRSNSALILASPDYLISSWCRLELQQLSTAKHAGRLRNLFWVQIRPCGWQHTELRDFQAFGAELAISEFLDETGRQRAILQACEQIASEILRSATDEDRDLAFVQNLLSEAPEAQNLAVNSVLKRSTLAIVCEGFDGSAKTTIKVLKFTPLEALTEALLRIGNDRKNLRDPSFKRLQQIFQVGRAGERRTIFVSDHVDYDTVLSNQLASDREKKTPLPVDTVALLLRRLSRGLREMHQRPITNNNEWEHTFGLLTPDDIFFDQISQRLAVPPIGISTILWHVLGGEKYAEWVDSNSKFYIAPEQRGGVGGRLTPQTDQYMLGRLALEMLEGLRFEQILDGKPMEQFWDKPEAFIGGSWKDIHPQLWMILCRLLQKKPSDRFRNMGIVVEELSGLEEEFRALAKSTYVEPGDTEVPDKLGDKFYEQFYQRFFTMSPKSKDKFESVEEQHKKLRGAMAAVLNFRPGNRPTSLEHILDTHRKMKISNEEFENFHKSFLMTINNLVSEPTTRKAWEDLLKPVTEYMITECAHRLEVARCTDSASACRPADKKGAGKEDPTQEELS